MYPMLPGPLFKRLKRMEARARNRANKVNRKGTYQIQVDRVNFIDICWKAEFKCAICGEQIDYSLRHAHQKTKPDGLTVEHLIPLAIGGDHTANNIAPAHSRCNQAKAEALLPYLERSRMLRMGYLAGLMPDAWIKAHRPSWDIWAPDTAQSKFDRLKALHRAGGPY